MPQSNERHSCRFVSYQIFFEIKNWRINRDKFYKLNPDIFVDLKNAYSIVMVIIDL